MLRRIATSFAQGFQTIRTRFMHTLLSVLGIVIGVAALVGTLSLIDGLERYGREQALNTTSLQAVSVSTARFRELNGVRIEKKDPDFLDYQNFMELRAALPFNASGTLYTSRNAIARVEGRDIGLDVIGCTYDSAIHPLAGAALSSAEIKDTLPKALINVRLGGMMAPGEPLASLVGKTILLEDRTLTITGVIEDKRDSPALTMPIGLFSREELKKHLPACTFVAQEVEEVNPMKDTIKSWLGRRYGKDAFVVISNEGRIQQALRGLRIFRFVMGLIVGLTILVGGIGIMNVLLISVNERTSEIGIRKAVGAKRSDILLQFLSESITISVFGSALGLVLGMLLSLAFLPIVSLFAPSPVPFDVVFTMNTLIVICIIALVVGVVFGTYPATRAARLDPVTAIQRD